MRGPRKAPEAAESGRYNHPMRPFLLVLALMAAAPLRAALVVPEGGLPEGRLSPGSALGLAFQPIATERWNALQAVVARGAVDNKALGSLVSLPENQGRLAAAPLQMILSDDFWARSAGFSSLSADKRAELVESLAFAQPRVSAAVDKRAPRALADAQRLIEQGRFGEEDLAWLVDTLDAMAVHGDKLRAAALEAHAALALSKARREAVAFSRTRDPGAVSGATTLVQTPLAPSSGESASSPRAPIPAPTVRSKRWTLKVGALAVGVYAADVATKAFAQAHLFSVFHEVAWRKPLMAFVVPFILYTAYTALTKLPGQQEDYHWSWRRIGSLGAGWRGLLGFTTEKLPGLDEVARSHPSIVKAFSHFEIAAGIMLGGLLGNAVDAFIKNGALDWIPVGRSLMNLADVAILLGLSYFQLSSIFFAHAARASRDRKAMTLDLTSFLGLPIVGFFAAWAFGSGPSDEPLALMMKSTPFIYLMGFSMLIGIARYVASLLIIPSVKKFNDDAARNEKK